MVRQAERDEGKRADGLTTAERAEMVQLRKELRETREERDILKRAVFLRPGDPMSRLRFVEAEKAQHRNVAKACKLLEVSRSAFYEFVQHRPSARQLADDALAEHIEETFDASRGTYGWSRVHKALREEGVHASGKRVARIMRQKGLIGRCRRRWTKTTISDPETRASDLLKRCFGPETVELDRVYVGDITCIWTWEGWLYLATVIDLASRRVVGWSMADHMRTELVADTFVYDRGRTSSRSGVDLPLRPRAVHRQGVHRPPGRARHEAVAVTAQPVLGQLGGGIVVRDPEGRIHRQSWATRPRSAARSSTTSRCSTTAGACTPRSATSARPTTKPAVGPGMPLQAPQQGRPAMGRPGRTPP